MSILGCCGVCDTKIKFRNLSFIGGIEGKNDKISTHLFLLFDRRCELW
jgi:hypothetical protein